MDPVRAAVLHALRVHPRLLQQGIGDTREERDRLYAALPRVVPFGGRKPLRVIAILDWDHHLPSRQLMFRLHLAYDDLAVTRLEQAFADRGREMKRRNLYPEFDLPDYEELPADESYEAAITLELTAESMRLVSAWRREVDPAIAATAVEIVRKSPAFARVSAAEPTRAPHLGDLEPVAWMPPCESGYARWTIDVWWLTAFDGRIGRGWSFLVDGEAEDPVIAHREFSVRAN